MWQEVDIVVVFIPSSTLKRRKKMGLVNIDSAFPETKMFQNRSFEILENPPLRLKRALNDADSRFLHLQLGLKKLGPWRVSNWDSQFYA